MLITITNGPSITDVLQTWFTGGTLLVAVVAAIVGLRQLGDYRRTAREQSRPYVLVDLALRGTLLMLEVKNVGTRPAAQIVVDFKPEIESTQVDWQQTIRTALGPDHPLPILAPGNSIQWFLDNGLTAIGRNDIPQEYDVRLEYHDLVPRKYWTWKNWRPVRMAEKYVEQGHRLSLRQFNQTALQEEGMPQLVKAVRDMGSTLDRMPAQLRAQRGFDTRGH
jgi:hypothetical protein